MRIGTAFAAAFGLALTACGDRAAEPDNMAAAPDAPTGSDAEVAADAALADEAARAEAEDAAIGGNVTAEDVSAAGNTVLNGQ